jgi:PKD repeat protein
VIAVSGLPGGQGWVPASAVIAENTGSVPVTTPPPLPTPTATPTAAPTVPSVFQGWKGEYFANPDVIEPPTLVRDDPQINFNWGAGAPAPGLPPNNYSVRWSRRQFFEAGTYTFSANVEGGVRLWLDGRLLIDSWQNLPLRLEQADSGAIERGDHDLRVDYRKLTGNGQIAVSWQLIPASPPTAVIDGPTTGQVGQELRFSARNSSATPGTQITDYDWRFGEGSTLTTMEAAIVYTAPGTYDVRLTVTASDGLTGEATQRVTISPQPQPPVAVINAPVQAFAGQLVTFDAGQSTGQSPIVSYQWRFGDGGTAGTATAQHIYAAPGVYTVQLTVVDSAGLSGTTSVQIQINPPPTAVPTLTAVPTAVVTQTPLEGPVWQLQETLTGTSITASFQGGRISGFGGCNPYSGSYAVSGEFLTIGLLATSNAACAQPIQEQETQYLATLQGAEEYEIEGNELRIDCQVGDQRIRLRYIATP